MLGNKVAPECKQRERRKQAVGAQRLLRETGPLWWCPLSDMGWMVVRGVGDEELVSDLCFEIGG